MNIDTYQITLCNLTSHHLEHFYAWASDPDVVKFMTWEVYTSRISADKFLKEVAEKHVWFKAICLNNIPIGSITLTPSQTDPQQAEFGYVLAKKYWGKGIATLAVKQAIELGFRDLPLTTIKAHVDPNNIASRRVLEKAGFINKGIIKDHILFKGRMRDSHLFSKSSG